MTGLISDIALLLPLAQEGHDMIDLSLGEPAFPGWHAGLGPPSEDEFQQRLVVSHLHIRVVRQCRAECALAADAVADCRRSDFDFASSAAACFSQSRRWVCRAHNSRMSLVRSSDEPSSAASVLCRSTDSCASRSAHCAHKWGKSAPEQPGCLHRRRLAPARPRPAPSA